MGGSGMRGSGVGVSEMRVSGVGGSGWERRKEQVHSGITQLWVLPLFACTYICVYMMW